LSLGVNQGGGFVRSRPGLERSEHAAVFLAGQLYQGAPGKAAIDERRTRFPGSSWDSSRPGRQAAAICTSSRRTLSRHPAIHPNYLSTNQDVADMLDGARLMRALAATPSLAAIIDERDRTRAGRHGDADMILSKTFAQRSDTVFHPVSTCRMGPDPARKRGRFQAAGSRTGRTLRIVDASVFPTVTSGNTNAPTMMVAEKASDMILSDWR
jgi:choline dehydrogenase